MRTVERESDTVSILERIGDVLFTSTEYYDLVVFSHDLMWMGTVVVT